MLEAEGRALGGTVVLSIPDGSIVEANLNDTQALAILSSNHVQWIDEWSPPQERYGQGQGGGRGGLRASSPGSYDGTGVRAEVMDGNVDAITGISSSGIIFRGSGSPSHGTRPTASTSATGREPGCDRDGSRRTGGLCGLPTFRK